MDEWQDKFIKHILHLDKKVLERLASNIFQYSDYIKGNNGHIDFAIYLMKYAMQASSNSGLACQFIKMTYPLMPRQLLTESAVINNCYGYQDEDKIWAIISVIDFYEKNP
jgi:hypothetical protein